MDLATRTAADGIVQDMQNLATWTPANLPTQYTNVIKQFGNDAGPFIAAHCPTQSPTT